MASIEDFGEYIPGAAKERFAREMARLANVTESDLTKLPLAEVFPIPNYTSLLDDGHDPWKVGFVRAVREALPPRPRNGLKSSMRKWLDTVNTARHLLLHSINSSLEDADFRESIEGMGSRTGVNFTPFLRKADLYKIAGHEKSLRDFRVLHDEENGYRLVSTAGKKIKAVLSKSQDYDEILRSFENYCADGLPGKTPAPPKLFTYTRGNDPRHIIGVKRGSGYIDLRKGHDRLELWKWAEENAALIEQRIQNFANQRSGRGETDSPRNGPSRRAGNVTPEMFMETFGFRGVQFGNYVENQRRQADLNNTWDALMDMAEILKLDPASLSLNGNLSIGFGARGKGGRNAAAAQYEPTYAIINLTKGKGAGCFAHEWMHALDHLIGMDKGLGDYLSSRRDRIDPNFHLSTLPFADRARDYDRFRTKPYWGTPVELAARGFEAWVKSELAEIGISNDWLANIEDRAVWNAENELLGMGGDNFPYPDGATEMRAVALVCANYIKAGVAAGILEPAPSLADSVTMSATEPKTTSVDGQKAQEDPDPYWDQEIEFI